MFLANKYTIYQVKFYSDFMELMYKFQVLLSYKYINNQIFKRQSFTSELLIYFSFADIQKCSKIVLNIKKFAAEHNQVFFMPCVESNL